MPKIPEEMDKYSCDNPSCDWSVIVEKGDITEAYGYHGEVQHITETGGSANVDWYACKGDCVLPAIDEVLRKDASR